MTWHDLAHQVMLETGQRVVDSRITSAMLLRWLTQARHELQSAFGVHVCSQRIALSSASTTGEYQLTRSARTVEECTYSSQATPEAWQPVTKMLYDDLHKYIWTVENNGLLAPQNDPSAWPNNSPIRVGFRTGTVVVYPYATEGYLRMRYKPHLMPYAASDTIDWSGWGVDPTNMMKTNGPEPEFYPAIEGIVAYAKMQLASMIGTTFIQFPMWARAWKEARGLVTKNSVGPQGDTKIIPTMGGIF